MVVFRKGEIHQRAVKERMGHPSNLGQQFSELGCIATIWRAHKEHSSPGPFPGLTLRLRMAPSFPGEAGTHRSYRTTELGDYLWCASIWTTSPPKEKTTKRHHCPLVPIQNWRPLMSTYVQHFCPLPKDGFITYLKERPNWWFFFGDRSRGEQSCRDFAAESLLAQPRDPGTHGFYAEWGNWAEYGSNL